MNDVANRSDILFLPWAGIDKELQIGPVLVSNWQHVRDSIPASADLDYIDWLFQLYVDCLGKQVSTIAICRHGGSTLKPITDPDLQDTFDAVSALAFASIFSSTVHAVRLNNLSYAPPSSDRFKLICHKILAEKAIVIGNAGKLQVWTADQPIQVRKPLHLIEGVFPKLNLNVLKALGQCLTSTTFDQNQRRRVFRALDWFKLAHSNADEVSWRTKVVMMATAFETLLDLRGGQKSSQIADFLDSCSPNNSNKRTEKDRAGKDVEHTLKGWWAINFYRTRNKITHGELVAGKSIHFNHGPGSSWLNDLIVSTIVFGECLIEVLSRGGLSIIHDDLSKIYQSFGWVS